MHKYKNRPTYIRTQTPARTLAYKHTHFYTYTHFIYYVCKDYVHPLELLQPPCMFLLSLLLAVSLFTFMR